MLILAFIVSFVKSEEVILRNSKLSLDIGFSLGDVTESSLVLKWDSRLIRINAEKGRIDLFMKEEKTRGQPKFLPVTSIVVTSNALFDDVTILKELEAGREYIAVFYVETGMKELVYCGRARGRTNYRFGPPRNSHFTEYSSTRFSVEWEPPHDSRKHFVISYKMLIATATDEYVVKSDIPAEDCVYEGEYSPQYAAPNEPFTLKLCAFSEKYVAWSDVTELKKPQTYPPTADIKMNVLNFLMEDEIRTKVTFRHEFKDLDGIIFRIWKRNKYQPFYSPGNSRSCTIPKLSPSNFYILSVAARDRFGLGAFSLVEWGTPPGKPIVESVSLGRGFIDIKWKHYFNAEDQSEELLPMNYRVRQRYANPVADWVEVRNKTTSTELKIEDLSDDNIYVVEITAMNEFGSSPSVIERVEMPKRLSRPQNVKAIAYCTFVDVSWETPSHDPRIIPDRFMLEMKKEDGQWQLVLIDLPFTENTFRFQNLESGCEYFFKIIPHDEYGNGECAIVSAKLGTVPQKIKDWEVVSITGNYISVSFPISTDDLSTNIPPLGVISFVQELHNLEMKTEVMISTSALLRSVKEGEMRWLVEFKNLKPSTSYNFGIGYEVEMEESILSTGLFGTAPSAPTFLNPDINREDMSVLLRWDHPKEIVESLEANSDNFVELSEFIVSSRIGIAISSLREETRVGASENRVLINNLREGVENIFILQARNRYGASEAVENRIAL